VGCRLVVRRVAHLGEHAKQGQDELFTSWRYHGFVTNSTLSTVQADEHHRDHAIVEQVIAELKDGPLAHAPSGKFTANAAWLTLATIAFNLMRAAGAAASPGTRAPGGPPCAPTSSPSQPGSPPPHDVWSCTSPATGRGSPPGRTCGLPPPTPDHYRRTGPEERPDVEEPDRPANPPRPPPNRLRDGSQNRYPTPPRNTFGGSGQKSSRPWRAAGRSASETRVAR